MEEAAEKDGRDCGGTSETKNVSGDQRSGGYAQTKDVAGTRAGGYAETKDIPGGPETLTKEQAG